MPRGYSTTATGARALAQPATAPSSRTATPLSGAAPGAGPAAMMRATCAYDPISPQIAMCGRTEWAERMCRKIEARRTRDMQERCAIGRTRSRSSSPAGGERVREARQRRLDKAAVGLVVKRTASRSASPDFRPDRERVDTFLQLVEEGERQRLLRPLAQAPDHDTHIPLKLRVLHSSSPHSPPVKPLSPTRSQNAPRKRIGFTGFLLRFFFGPLPVRRKEREREGVE
jgi:hypothetical protein